MMRFPKSRWTLILALWALASGYAVRTASAAYEDGCPLRVGDPDPNPISDPSAGGDPDQPDGKTAWSKTLTGRGALEGPHAGDVWTLRSDGMWRLILILKGLRLYWFRF